jgi:8-oxo-dGTP pyrophosphatase MutT (NUDIX family)
MSLPELIPVLRASLGALALLTDEAGRILLVQTTYDGNRWHLPGGYVEANESPEETVARELREELKLTVEVLGLNCIAYKAYDPNISLVYRCRIISGNPVPDGNEIEAWDYFRLDCLPAGLSDRTKKIIDVSLGKPLDLKVITFKQP